MRDLVMLAAFFGMLPFILIRPHIGVLMWGWVALLGPGSIMWGMAGSVRYNFIVAALTFLSWVVSKERVKIPATKTLFLVLMLALVTTGSTFTAIGSEADALREWEKYLKVVALFLVVMALINTRGRIHAYLWALLLALGYHGVKEGLRFILSGGGHHIFGPDKVIIEDNNHFALAMLMALPIVFYLFRSSANRLTRYALLGTFGILFVTVIGTHSRGGFVGMAAVVAWMLLTGKGKIRLLLMVIPMLLAALSLAPAQWFERMETIETAQEDSSFSGRVVAWKLSTLIAMDHPFFGGGFYAVQDFPTWSYYSGYIHQFDFIPSKAPDTQRAHAAHSIYFQVLGDHGFLGLFLFLLVMLATWLNTGRAMRRARGSPALVWAYDLAYALRLSLIAYAVSGAAVSMAYFDLFYSIVGLSVSLLLIVERSLARTEQARAQPGSDPLPGRRVGGTGDYTSGRSHGAYHDRPY